MISKKNNRLWVNTFRLSLPNKALLTDLPTAAYSNKIALSLSAFLIISSAGSTGIDTVSHFFTDPFYRDYINPMVLLKICFISMVFIMKCIISTGSIQAIQIKISLSINVYYPL